MYTLPKYNFLGKCSHESVDRVPSTVFEFLSHSFSFKKIIYQYFFLNFNVFLPRLLEQTPAALWSFPTIRITCLYIMLPLLSLLARKHLIYWSLSSWLRFFKQSLLYCIFRFFWCVDVLFPCRIQTTVILSSDGLINDVTWLILHSVLTWVFQSHHHISKLCF